MENNQSMFKRIAHVCLNVKDLERSIEYYGRLGFARVFKFTRNDKDFGAYLEISEGNYVEMFENPAMGAAENVGLAHFCLEAEDIDAVMEGLRTNGVDFTAKKLGCDDTYQIWLRDPDGNAFEVHQYTATSSQRTGRDVEADW